MEGESLGGEDGAPGAPRASDVLRRLRQQPHPRIAVQSVLDALGDHSFAALVLLLGLPNCIPMPPPIPTFCALLLLPVALQIAFGRKTPWAPLFLRRRSMARVDLEYAIDRALPLVCRLEQWSRPRFAVVGSGLGRSAIGIVLVALAVGMLTAAPFVGQIPFGLAVSLVGLGMVERDGVLVAGGVAIGALGGILTASFVYALIVLGKGLL